MFPRKKETYVSSEASWAAARSVHLQVCRASGSLLGRARHTSHKCQGMEGERLKSQTQVETEAERAGSLAAGPDRSTTDARGWREGCRGISTAASQ